jgi:hypothetical protein
MSHFLILPNSLCLIDVEQINQLKSCFIRPFTKMHYGYTHGPHKNATTLITKHAGR